MKKLISSLVLATTISTANAMSLPDYVGAPRPQYEHSYNAGYRAGKHDAYNNVARTAVIVGTAVIAGVIIYQLGKESRWTTNEKGVVYRF